MKPYIKTPKGWGIHLQNPNTGALEFCGYTDDEAWEYITKQSWYVEGMEVLLSRTLLNGYKADDSESTIDVAPE